MYYDMLFLQLGNGQYVEYTTAAYESGRLKVCIPVNFLSEDTL